MAAEEPKKGRILLIGTTNKGVQQPVIWKFGQTAESCRPIGSNCSDKIDLPCRRTGRLTAGSRQRQSRWLALLGDARARQPVSVRPVRRPSTDAAGFEVEHGFVL